MPRRSGRAKPESPANTETRVTRRSLRTAASPEAPKKTPPAKETKSPATKAKRGGRSASRRGRGAAEENVEEEEAVEAAELGVTEVPEEVLSSPKKRSPKSPARGRGRARGRPQKAATVEDNDAESQDSEVVQPSKKTTESPPTRARHSRSATNTSPQKDSGAPTRGRRGRSAVATEESTEAEATATTEASPSEQETRKRKREEEAEAKPTEEQSEKKLKVDEVNMGEISDTPGDAPKDEDKESVEAMETDETVRKGDGNKVDATIEPAIDPETAKESESSKANETPEEPSKETPTVVSKKSTETTSQSKVTPEEDTEMKTPEEVAKADVEAEPRVKEPVPETKDALTEVKKTKPEVGKVESEVKEAVPLVKTKDTTIKEAVPEVKKAEIEVKVPSSKIEETKKPEESAITTEDKSEEVMETNTSKPESSGETDVAKGYVVINMGDVPPSDSAEVIQSMPSEKTPNDTPKVLEPDSTEETKAAAVPVITATTEETTEGTEKKETENSSTLVANGNGIAPETVDHNIDPLFTRKYIANPNLSPDVNLTKKFSLVSYNILADSHIRAEHYSWMDSDSLRMEARHKRFIRELEYLDADVICLQEVDADYYDGLLSSTLKALGYEGTFKKKDQSEGEATFFRTSKFLLVSSRGLALRDLACKELEACGLDAEKAAAAKVFIDKPSVVLITQLRCVASGAVVTVGNLHLSWENLTKQDLQCIQMACAVKEVVSMCDGPNSAYVICGDFNAWPETAVYQLTKEGYLNDSSTNALRAIKNVDMSDGTKAALINLWWTGFQHTSSSLRSCYGTVIGKEPVSTRYPKTGTNKNVDYIWCGGTTLDIAGVTQTAPESLISGGIPNAVFPSDHLSLKAELFFK